MNKSLVFGINTLHKLIQNGAHRRKGRNDSTNFQTINKILLSSGTLSLAIDVSTGVHFAELEQNVRLLNPGDSKFLVDVEHLHTGCYAGVDGRRFAHLVVELFGFQDQLAFYRILAKAVIRADDPPVEFQVGFVHNEVELPQQGDWWIPSTDVTFSVPYRVPSAHSNICKFLLQAGCFEEKR